MAPSETPDRADPVTRLIAGQVEKLRKNRGMTQADLGAEMAKLRKGWSRSTVVKLETFKRQEVSIADWMALAMVLGVPPTMLIADPRLSKTMPIPASGDTPESQWGEEYTWNVLWWMLGRNKITPTDFEADRFEYYQNAMEIIHAGWEIMEATFQVNQREHRWPDSDEKELVRLQQRENSRHTDAIVRISQALDRLDARGAARPPIEPFVVKRARQLNFEVSDWATE